MHHLGRVHMEPNAQFRWDHTELYVPFRLEHTEFLSYKMLGQNLQASPVQEAFNYGLCDASPHCHPSEHT